MKNRKILSEGKISSHIISLSIPLIISNIFNTIFELIDAIFIGKLGASALAGVTIAGTVLFFLATFGGGLSVGTVALISRFTGAKEYNKANEVAFQSIIIGAIFSVIFGILGYIFASDILFLLGAKGDVLTSGSFYIKILFSGIITMFFLFIGSAILRGSGDMKTPMFISIIATIINIILDWLLIFGNLGFPCLGIKGGALATIIGRGIGGLIILIILFRGEHNISLKKMKFKINFSIIYKIIKIGFPASIQMFVRSTSAIILVKIVSFFGTATIAAYGIGARINSLFLLPGFGFADTSATMVGQNLGAHKLRRARKSVYTSSFYYFIVLLFFSFFVFLFSKDIVKIFNSNKDVISIGSIYLKFIAISSLSLSVGLVFSRSFQGAGNAVTPMIITIISLYVVQLPLAYLLSIYLKIGKIGIWISQLIASYLQAFLIFWLFKKNIWLKKIKQF